jgi:hypothetical protein
MVLAASKTKDSGPEAEATTAAPAPPSQPSAAPPAQGSAPPAPPAPTAPPMTVDLAEPEPMTSPQTSAPPPGVTY